MLKSNPRATEIKRVGRFGMVGVFNTVLDFTLYNLLHTVAGWGLIVANVVSTTIAMSLSFFFNKQLVFKQPQGSVWRQASIFLLTTAFGLYVLQNGTITLLVEIWPAPLQLAVAAVHAIGLGRFFSDTFITINGAKAVATVVSLTWNYMMYKKVVFRA